METGWSKDSFFFVFFWAASEKGKAYLKFSTILNPSQKKTLVE
jgi:hypothetical protein